MLAILAVLLWSVCSSTKQISWSGADVVLSLLCHSLPKEVCYASGFPFICTLPFFVKELKRGVGQGENRR